MRCPQCQHENRDTAKFCEVCSAALVARTCTSCGAELRSTASFCDECGARAGPQAAPFEQPDPRSYTPKHLADKILSFRSALEGERKQVTVLFADVKGSMELAEQIDPEEWHRILDRFFQILAEGVHRFEGTVNQYTGDGIMALFGAPIAHEDHAQRACYAALHLRDELRRYADELRRSAGLSFSVRMGISSGEVVVGRIGDDLRMDYTAQGHTVGLAARIEQLAAPDSAYVTELTAQCVSGFFDLLDLGQFELKGIRQPLRIYELQGLGRLRTRLERSRARGFSRFIGRGTEMKALEVALEQALEGAGQIVGVVGEAGVGKSRLCYEFIERCKARGTMVYQAHCVAHGRLIPLLPILELLRDIFGIGEHDDARAARRKIAGTMVLLDEQFRDELALLFDLMGVADPDRPAPNLDPEARQKRLSSLTRRVVRVRSEHESAVIFMDDLHWIDPTSDLHLATWVEAILGTRTLLLTNFRPEYHADWMGKSYYQQLPLKPLGAEATSELLDELLGCDPSLAGLSEHIGQRSGGNPFFTEEIVQSLVESGELEGQRGAYRLAGAASDVSIPSTVQTVLAARIDRLPEREKTVLQAAAVVGRSVAEPVLAQVVDLSPAELTGAFALLTDAEFLHEQAVYPEAEYSFKHPLTQEVAYGSQLTEKRRHSHARVAGAIAEQYPERLDELAALLAHHWEQAAEAWEAACWHERAAAQLMLKEMAAALEHWRRVRELLRTCEQTPQAARLELTACNGVLQCQILVGVDLAEVAEVFERGSALAERLGDRPTHAILTARYVGAARMGGRPNRELADLVAKAGRLANEAGDEMAQAYVLFSQTGAFHLTGNVGAGLAAAEGALRLSRGNPRFGFESVGLHLVPWLLWYKGDLHSQLGRHDDALRESKRLLELATELGQIEPAVPILAHTRLADIGWYTQQDPQGALTHARRAVDAAEKLGSSVFAIYAYEVLAKAHAVNGQWGEGISAAEHSLSIASASPTGVPLRAASLRTIASASLELGEVQRARENAHEAVVVATELGAATIELVSRTVEARVLTRIGGSRALAEAQDALDRALRLLEETGAKGHEPLVRVELAELARVRGDPATCRRELREAHRLFTEMGAMGHAERIAKELGA